MGVGGQRQAPAAVPPVKARYPLFNKWKGNIFLKSKCEIRSFIFNHLHYE